MPAEAQAGPLVRRAQERRACQEFAGRLQQASGNLAMAQQVYQQGVLELVSRFGENPCGDIPAPTAAAVTPANPAATTSPGTAPAAGSPAATTAPAVAPASPAAAPSGAAAATGGTPAAASSSQQQQACQQFAGKLQAAAASGGAAAAQQTYTMGLQKLSGMFGPNPCPAVKAPQ